MQHQLSRLQKSLLGSLVVLFSTTSAQAQWSNPYWGTTWNNPTSSLLQTHIMGRAMSDAIVKQAHAEENRKRHKSAAGKTSPEQARSIATPLLAKVIFRPAANGGVANALAERIGSSLEEREQLQKLFTEFVTSFEKQAREAKQSYNVARAISFFIAVNYSVYKQQEVEAAAFNNLTQSLQLYLAQSAPFLKMNNGQKQNLYETLVILGTLVGSGYQDGEEKKIREQMDTFRAMAKNNLETLLGVPVTKLKFTKTSLIIS